MLPPCTQLQSFSYLSRMFKFSLLLDRNFVCVMTYYKFDKKVNFGGYEKKRDKLFCFWKNRLYHFVSPYGEYKTQLPYSHNSAIKLTQVKLP